MKIKKHPLGNYVSKLVSASVFIDWSEVLITEFFDHLEVLSLEIESEQKRLIYYNYIDYLRTQSSGGKYESAPFLRPPQESMRIDYEFIVKL